MLCAGPLSPVQLSRTFFPDKTYKLEIGSIWIKTSEPNKQGLRHGFRADFGVFLSGLCRKLGIKFKDRESAHIDGYFPRSYCLIPFNSHFSQHLTYSLCLTYFAYPGLLNLICSDVFENDLSVGKFTEKQKIVYNAVLRANR